MSIQCSELDVCLSVISEVGPDRVQAGLRLHDTTRYFVSES